MTKSPENKHLVPPMTVEAATDYARGVHGFLQAGARTDDDLRKARAKGCDVSVFDVVAIEKATQDDDDLRAIEADLAAVAAKVKARKSKAKARRPALHEDGFED